MVLVLAAQKHLAPDMLLSPTVSGCLAAGLDMSDVREAGKRLPLREGCRETLDAVVASGVPVHIMSVNWSAQYVAAALGPNACITLR